MLCCVILRCRERDRLYGRAEKVAGLLAHLGDQLKDAIADVNESTCESQGPAWLQQQDEWLCGSLACMAAAA
jgi:hypothetical protein